MKKKILYICSEASSGIIPYAVNIIKSASKSPLLDVYAITVDSNKLSYRHHFEEPLAKRITFMKIPSKKTKKYFNKIYAKEIWSETKKIAQNKNIDIIHLLTIDYTCSLIIPQLKKLGKVYYTIHDLIPHEKAFNSIKERLFHFYMEWAVKRAIRQADYLVTNSKSQYKSIRDMYSDKNTYYHHFPSLILDSIQKGKNECPEIKNAGKYILYFGSIEKYKGIEYLYEAFNNSNFPDYKLVIAGSGTIYFHHDANSRIIFINRYIKDDEIRILFERATCVVYPYISATQSGVLSLAYKFQTPALVSDIPFFQEYSDKNCCLFFNKADTFDLSRQLKKLLLQTDLKKMKEAQQEFYDHNYSETAIMHSIEGIY